jgi:chromosome segregation ATPase
MMQTYSEIMLAESERLQQAWQYEKLTGNIATLKKEIDRLQPKLQSFEAEITLLQKMMTLAQGIDKRTEGGGGYEARTMILSQLSGAVGFNETQRDKIKSKLAVIQKELPKLEARLAAFVEPTTTTK